tara:strand:- start:211 stop:420 length:210 start_codon:yes stop_codon:yes gene_type:complete
MTPKEKALELVDTYCRAKLDNGIIGIYQPLAKQCALICVDEMIGNYEEKYKYCKSKQFLEEVKQEINKL